MKRLVPLVFLAIPLAAFAQGVQGTPARETAILKKLGLTDSQVAKVLDIHAKTRTVVRQDVVEIRLLRAEMEKALLPDNVDMQAVNRTIDQIAQTRADMQKALVAARVQLRQIMGDDNFHEYARFLRSERGRDRFGPMPPRRLERGRQDDG